MLYLLQKYTIDCNSALELALGVSGVSTSGGVINNEIKYNKTWHIFSLLICRRKMWKEIIQLSLCRWLCIHFTSHNQALFNPSLSGLELLKPIINSYFFI